MRNGKILCCHCFYNKGDHEDDEGALICRCFGVTSTRIRRIVLENSLTTAEQVTNYVKAGGGCGSCLTDIDDIIVDVAEEGFTLTGDLSSEANIPELEVKTLTNLQKITLIQQVLEEEVKPALAKDGGDVELFDIEGSLIKVVLKGACSSCSSSTFTLKTAIEARLRERISKDLTVIAV